MGSGGMVREAQRRLKLCPAWRGVRARLYASYHVSFAASHSCGVLTLRKEVRWGSKGMTSSGVTCRTRT